MGGTMAGRPEASRKANGNGRWATQPRTRPDVYVVSRILHVLVSQGPVRPTHLQCLARLNYWQFEGYLELLKERHLVDLVDDERGGHLVRLTAGGQHADRLVNATISCLDGIPAPP